MPTKMVGLIGSIGAAIATLWGGASFVDTRYAHAPDMVRVEFRLEQKILADRSAQLQSRLWKIEDRYPDLSIAPDTVKEEYRQIKEELADLDQEQSSVQQEYKRQGNASGSRYYEKKSSK